MFSISSAWRVISFFNACCMSLAMEHTLICPAQVLSFPMGPPSYRHQSSSRLKGALILRAVFALSSGSTATISAPAISSRRVVSVDVAADSPSKPPVMKKRHCLVTPSCSKCASASGARLATRSNRPQQAKNWPGLVTSIRRVMVHLFCFRMDFTFPFSERGLWRSRFEFSATIPALAA